MSYILIVFVLSCTFWKKVRKTSAHGKIFASALCSRHHCEPSVGHLLVTSGYRLFSGCCGSHCVRHFFKKYNCRTTFGRASHSGLKTSGLALDFSTVPFNKLLTLAAKSQTSLDFAHLRVTFRRWRGITFAMEYSANFCAYNGNIKYTPAPLKDTT